MSDMRPSGARNSVYADAIGTGGRLTFVGRIPVLCVSGSPEVIGIDVAELALRPAARLLSYPTDYLRSRLRVPPLPRLIWSLLRRPCEKLYRNLPERYRAE